MCKYLLSLLMLVVFLLGCTREQDEPISGATISPHLVQVYVEANDFDLWGIDTLMYSDNFAMGLRFTGGRVHSGKKFYEYARTFKDTAYMRRVVLYSTLSLSEKLSAITVTCDKDFDAAHQAGSSLGDIVLFCASSPYRFIQRGYKDKITIDHLPNYWKSMVMFRGYDYEPIEMLVSEFDAQQTLMIYPTSYLVFKKRPTHAGEYTFTISMQIKDQVITKTIQQKF